MKEKIGIIQHGCSKNLIDTELMAGILLENGYEITLDWEAPDVKSVIINTCSFVHDAEKESVQSILCAIALEKRVIVVGCLPQKHKDDLKKAIPEIEAMIGTTDFGEIIAALGGEDKISENPCYVYPEEVKRAQITVGASSYIKIADGCDFACSYCIIPKLRGKYRSRKPEDIIKEAKMLADKGVAEIILIAQDTTSYGKDLKDPGGDTNLAKLLSELNKIENLNWIRVLYTYPTGFDDELIDAFASLNKVVKYIDMPLQYSHSEVLAQMKRPKIDYEKLISKIRAKIPNVALRTTFITGYPTETGEQFAHLKNFIKKVKFDRLGVFEFSREKGTYADTLRPQIPAKVKRARKNELLSIQKEISNELNKRLVGKKIPCIIEEVHSDGTAIARSFRDAPEIDGLVYLKLKNHVNPCDIVEAKITHHKDYDLFGETDGSVV